MLAAGTGQGWSDDTSQTDQKSISDSIPVDLTALLRHQNGMDLLRLLQTVAALPEIWQKTLVESWTLQAATVSQTVGSGGESAMDGKSDAKR